VIVDHKGLGGPDSTSVSVGGPYIDGSVYQDRNDIQERVIDLQLAITRRGLRVDPVVQKIYRFFCRRKPITIIVEKVVDGIALEYEIEGVVESLEMAHFAITQNANISIKCHQPFFKLVSKEPLYVSRVHKHFMFPFSNPVGEQTLMFGNVVDQQYLNVAYSGDVPSGVVMVIGLDSYFFSPVGLDKMHIHFASDEGTRTVTINKAKIDEMLPWSDPLGHLERDTLVLDTRIGKRSLVLIREDGTAINAINGLEWVTGKWPELVPGNNTITVTYTPEWEPDIPTVYDAPSIVRLDLETLYQGV
jgi:hypothetical protein